MQTGIKKLTAHSAEQFAETIRAKLDCPVALIGMMGVGKSKLGRMMAKALDLPFYDSDAEIEASAGCTVPEIFERYGEVSFRQAEAKIIDRLIGQGICIIATGGGSVMTAPVAEQIWNRTVSLWVRADLDLMVDRTARNIESRPLLAGKEPRAALAELMEKRYPTYQKANMVIDSHDGPATDTLYQALSALYSYLDKPGANP
jgi:shikimate kinase